LDSLLDTNVVSQSTKLIPDPRVVAWLAAIRSAELYLSAISLAEIRFGIQEMDPGRKRSNFEHWLELDLRQSFAGRILAVDERIAEEAGRLASIGKKDGARPQLADALIAATARMHGLRLATLNHRHFENLGVELVKF
jgi:predicted nucleic acid-binding protein